MLVKLLLQDIHCEQEMHFKCVGSMIRPLPPPETITYEQSACCCVHAAIPATVVAAASFDDAIAITGYTLFINLAVRGGGNTTWNVMHGPLSLLFGVLSGLLAGGLCSMTRLWNNSFKRTAVMFFTGARRQLQAASPFPLPQNTTSIYFCASNFGSACFRAFAGP